MSDAYCPISELNLLKELQDSLEGQFFATGFELIEYNDDLDWFCGDAPDAYLDRLSPFAYASSSGSYYAPWRCDDRTDLTRPYWQGRWDREGGFHAYDGCIPIVATTLELLREHGPAGPAFWHFGREDREPLLDAIGNPRRDAALARRRAGAREEQWRREEREAWRPVCTDCGRGFTDDRCAVVDVRDRGQPRESHPHLCEDCQSRAVADPFLSGASDARSPSCRPAGYYTR